jgi:formylglycine-generating enzyme required for sulfatase activity
MPWDSSSLTGDFYFVAPGKGGPAPALAETAAPAAGGGSLTPIVLEQPEAALARSDLETPAAFARRIAALPPVSLGKAYLRVASYHPDAQRLPVGLWFQPWAGPYIPVRFGIMEVELGQAEARKVAAESTEYPLVGRFAVEGDRVTCALQVLFSEGPRPLLQPFPTPPARPAPGQVWFEPAAGLELCWIPPGTFTMGSPTGEAKRSANEGPAHAVTLAQGFWMGRCEVTQGQYMAIVRGNPSKFRTDAHFNPVEQVSWDEARAWIAQLNAKAGTSRYRLPSEAEWEYACRAGNPGAAYGAPGAIGWSKLNSGQYTHPIPGITLMGKYQPHRAGGMAPNAWGLCDMLGNVAEWCEDAYHPDYTGAPADGRPWLESGEPGRRVVRGGDWDHSQHNLRAAFRSGEKADRKDSTLGFRVVREAAP